MYLLCVALCEVNYAESANMQNVKFPGLTFIILATSELEQLYFEMSISIRLEH